MHLFLKKNHLLRYRNVLSLLNWIGALKLCLLQKLLPSKLELLFVPVSFSWSCFCLCKFTIQPCMEYFRHALGFFPSYYLYILNKLQKQICKPVGPSLFTSFEAFALCPNVASLSLLYRYYCSRY